MLFTACDLIVVENRFIPLARPLGVLTYLSYDRQSLLRSSPE